MIVQVPLFIDEGETVRVDTRTGEYVSRATDLIRGRTRERDETVKPPMRRSDQRRDAVFAHYQRDVTGRPLEELIVDAQAAHARAGRGGRRRREELDAEIAAYAKGWTVDRIAPLDLNVMRVALYEIEHGEESRSRSRSTRRSRSPRSTAAPTRPNSSTASSARSSASGSRPSERPPREIAERLRQITGAGRGRGAGHERAADLAAEAADLSAEAVEEANRQAREAASSE